MINREKLGFFHKWWLAIDKKLLSIFLIFIVLSCIFIFTSSVSVANRIELNDYYFFIKHLQFVVLSIITTTTLSLFNENFAKKILFLIFITSLTLLILIPIIGFQTKGAKRWIYICGFSLQPTEFIKPALILLNAYYLSKFQKTKDKKFFIMPIIAYLICLFFIYKQPDFGTIVLITIAFTIQIFLSDIMSIKMCSILIICFAFIFILAYTTLPHVSTRIQNFIISVKDPEKAVYQVKRSIMGYQNAGLLGRGFMEGEVKNYIPDVHTDFIFPAITEEVGFIISFIIICIYFYTALRVLLKSVYDNENDNFKFFALFGLGILFIIQTSINICVSLNLAPTKGMTLPFLSYGGSSLLGMSINFGFILILTKKNYKIEQQNTDLFLKL